ncbi:hypothetical protein GCM10023092_17360 [Rurimicrobium arvi]|uniref:Secretion system C-terminal sorting domain-containing protein n=2 Tax=Rurimicrobium arvi TaxID=2049916 RepID=A0ABP8MRM1_9BACT
MVDINGFFDASGANIAPLLGYRGELHSEIEVFPNGSACDNYYVICAQTDFPFNYVLKIFNVDASVPTAISVTALPDLISWYGNPDFTSDPAHYVHTWNKQGVGYPVVTSPVKSDGSRIFYTVCRNNDGLDAVGNPINPRLCVRSWRFAADGTYAEQPEVRLVEQSGAAPNDATAHMTIADISSDGNKIAYPGPYGLNVYNVITGTVMNYPIPDLYNRSDLDVASITGIEWLPQFNRWYVSYVHLPVGAPKAVGNMIYFNDGSTTINSVGFTLPAGTGASEIELGKDFRLYFAGCPTCSLPGSTHFVIGGSYAPAGGSPVTSPGTLYSFDPGNPSLGFTSHPTLVKGSTYNGFYYYINNQIDGEDLSYWSGSSSSIVADATINNRVSLTSPGLCYPASSWGQLQILDNSYLIMEFKDLAGNPVTLSPKEEYSISWEEVNPCGYSSIPGSALNYSDTWHSGSGPINLSSYGSGALGSISNYGKYIGVEIKVRNKCNPADIQSYKSLIMLDSNALDCDANFRFEMSIQSSGTPQLLGDIVPRKNHPGSTYTFDYGFTTTSYPVTNVYTPGSYTVCLTENKADGSKCTKCIDVCYADPFPSSAPAAGTPDCNSNFTFKYNYASDGSPVANGSVFLDSYHPSSTYSYNWGDGTVTSNPISKHYAPGNYTICVSEYPAAPMSLPCITCMDICISAGGDIMSRTTTEPIAKGNSILEDKMLISPNPARDNTDLTIELSADQMVQITMADIMGRQVSSIHKGYLQSGQHKFKINTENLSSGIYQVQLTTGNKVSTQKLSVVK